MLAKICLVPTPYQVWVKCHCKGVSTAGKRDCIEAMEGQAHPPAGKTTARGTACAKALRLFKALLSSRKKGSEVSCY